MDIADRANRDIKDQAARDISGQVPPRAGRFVLLRHEMPALEKLESHWDLMLELTSSLLTFQCLQLPPKTPFGQSFNLETLRIADHRMRYLEYEGPISKGRGTVFQVAKGRFQKDSIDENDPFFVFSATNLSAKMEIPSCAIGDKVSLRIREWTLTNDRQCSKG